MSQEEIQRLLAEEEALKAKLAGLQGLRAELVAAEKEREEQEAKERELKKEVRFTIAALSGGSLLFVGPYRSDTVDIFKSTPGRRYRGQDFNSMGKNFIPLTEYQRCIDRLLERPNVEIEWGVGVQEEVEWYLTAPPWEVDLHPSRRHFIAKAGPRVRETKILEGIPGAQYEYEHKTWKVGLAEGWRIFDALKDIEGVVWTDAAKGLVFEQVEARSRLDKIAGAEDTDFITHLNGNELRPFQRVGVEFIHTAGGRVLLADATGLGKTWQAYGYAEKMRETDPDFQTIISAKSANIPNWIREGIRLTGIEPVQCISGTPDFFVIQKIVTERHPYVIISHDTLGIKKMIDNWRDCPIRWENDSHVLCAECGGTGKINNPNVVFPWSAVLKGAKPDLLVIDEAHKIKNPDANRTQAHMELVEIPHMLPMTASPIMNRMEELWTPLFMLDPTVFASQTAFLNTYTWGGQRPKNTKRLHEMMRPMFLRRTKKDVLKDLPPINRIYHYVKLSERAQHRYQEVLRGIWTQMKEYDPRGIGGKRMNTANFLSQITRLKQICAADKAEFTADLATDLADQMENEGNGGKKILIFSHFLGSARAIADRLGAEAVCTVNRTEHDFVSLDTVKRDELFESVRNDPRVKFIVTTEAASEGHNLEFCDFVIFNDPFWTPLAHDQCEGRAYGRLSDPHPIDSIYVYADVQVEKWIQELLAIKLEITEEAVDGVESTRDLDGSIATALMNLMEQEMWSK